MAKTLSQTLFNEFSLNKTTEIALRINRKARKAKKFGKMELVIGFSGIGKSKGIEAYMEEDKDVVLVKCRRGMRKNRFMQKLALNLGIKKRMTYDDYIDEIVDVLKETKKLIVIDEPEHITIEAIDGLRYINDEAEVGMLFVALPEFLQYIKGHRRDYEYVYNRLGVTYEAKELSLKDYEKLIQGVVPVEYAPLLYTLSGGTLDKDKVKGVKKVGYACTRFMRTILQESILYALENNILLTDTDKMEKVFRKAAEELDVNNRLK